MDSNSFRALSHLPFLQRLDGQHSKRNECVDQQEGVHTTRNQVPSAFGRRSISWVRRLAVLVAAEAESKHLLPRGARAGFPNTPSEGGDG
jgi:hypothetical protein